jgi:hypothetical protein
MVQLSLEREREELQYVVIMLSLPFISLFKLWPTKIVPCDNSFFMDFFKMHQSILDKELVPKNVKASCIYTCTSANEQVTPSKSLALTPVISVL